MTGPSKAVRLNQPLDAKLSRGARSSRSHSAGDSANSLDAANEVLPKGVHVGGRNPSHHIFGGGDNGGADIAWDPPLTVLVLTSYPV